MNQTDKLFEAVRAEILEMDSRELMDLNNLYCDSAGYGDCEIYSNDENFFDTYFSGDKMRLVQAVCYGDYNYHHDYVQFDGYENLKSFDRLSIEDLPESLNDVAQYIAQNFNEFEDYFEVQESDFEDDSETI